MGAVLTSDLAPPSADAALRDVTRNDERVHRAVLACIARFGLTKTTIDDIAGEAGVSRATIYRRFPGGRDGLIQAVLVAEIDRFFDELGATVEPLDELEDLVVAGIATSMRFILGHDALRAVIAIEPGLVLPQFAFHRLDAVLAHAADFARPLLAPHLASAHEAATAAEHLVRIVLSYTVSPDPRVDPDDEASIRRLVRTFVLPGLTPGS